MKKCQYTYNATAANLSRGNSSTIYVVIPALGSSVFSATVMGIQEYAFKHRFNVIVSSSNYNGMYEADILQQACEQRCAGILLSGFCRDNEKKVKQLADSGLPVVIMWEQGSDGLNSVGFDNYQVTREVIEYMIGLGHRRIAGIFGPYSLFRRAQMRLEAYRDVLGEYDIPYDTALVSENRPTIEDGKRVMTELLKLKNRPTAVFCSNDLQAVGAFDVIRRADLNIPEDISVFGFDDIELAAYLSPALSTVHVPSYDIGRLAAERLLNMLTTHQATVVQHIVKTQLIIRESCSTLLEPK
jgi:DNA-binding LacI/PurR family transcriptional regulator